MGEIIKQKYVCIALVLVFIVVFACNFAFAEEDQYPYKATWKRKDDGALIYWESKSRMVAKKTDDGILIEMFDGSRQLDSATGKVMDCPGYFYMPAHNVSVDLISSNHDIKYANGNLFFQAPEPTYQEVFQMEVEKVPGVIREMANPIITQSGIILGIGLLVCLIVRWVYLFAQ